MNGFRAVFLASVCFIGYLLLVVPRTAARDDDPFSKGAHFPKIVAQINQAFPAANLPQTMTLYTPEETGLYRINGYAVVTNLDPNAVFVPIFFFGWTDEQSTKTQQEVAGNPSGLAAGRPFYLPNFNQVGAYSSTCFVLRSAASTPITFSASDLLNPGIPGNDEFSVYFTVEKL